MAPVATHYVPKQIASENFEIGLLKSGSYTIEDISKAIIRYITQSKLTTKQQDGIWRFQHQGTWNLGDPHNLQDVRKFFEILNDIFLNGLLTGLCDIELYEFEYGQHCDETCRYIAEGLDPYFKNNRPLVTISLRKNTRLYGYPCIALKHIRRLLEVLAGQMVQAMFYIYSCRCKDHCYEEFHALETIWKGRNLYWIEVSSAIEKATDHFCYSEDELLRDGDGFLLELNLCLSRYYYLAVATHNGAKLPSNLRLLDLDAKAIIEEQERRRLREGSLETRETRRQWVPMKANVCFRDNWTVDAWDYSRVMRTAIEDEGVLSW